MQQGVFTWNYRFLHKFITNNKRWCSSNNKNKNKRMQQRTTHAEWRQKEQK